MTIGELNEILVNATALLTETELTEIINKYFLRDDIQGHGRRLYIDKKISAYSEQQRTKCSNRFNERLDQINMPVKIVIVGESPINYNKYFYQTPGSYLTCIKHYLAWDNIEVVQPNPNAGLEHVHYRGNQNLQIKEYLENPVNFYNTLSNFGVLVWDIYEWPLPSIIYRKEHTRLLDNKYVLNQVNHLINNNIIDNNTRFVFRYDTLINRGLFNQENLVARNFINRDGVPVRLALKDKGYTVLTNEVIDFFEDLNFRVNFQKQF